MPTILYQPLQTIFQLFRIITCLKTNLLSFLKLLTVGKLCIVYVLIFKLTNFFKLWKKSSYNDLAGAKEKKLKPQCLPKQNKRLKSVYPILNTGNAMLKFALWIEF